MQAARVRVLEDGTYRRVGETAPRHADVRVVSATCRDLGAVVEAGTFRRDLRQHRREAARRRAHHSLPDDAPSRFSAVTAEPM